MSPIRSIGTTLAAGAILSFSLLLGCSNEEASNPVTPAGESAEATPSNTATSAPAISATPALMASSSPTASPAVPVTPTGIASQFLPEGLADSVIINSVNEAGTVRARAATERGELLMISSGPEERGHLNVSSNYGLEGDQTYQADYSIVYREDGQDQELLKFPALLFVRQSDQVLKFDKVSFKDAEVYLLAPQYKSGHGLVAYAFAVNKISGEVFPLSFVQGELVQDMLVFSENQPAPANLNEQLVVHSPEGAGGDPELKPRVYDLDLDKRQFIAR
ncbi:hypothetical protein KDC22_30245 [Paenibacillus tritici]|uniref:hypothetical protein n=1 Tax=Paenibacillus tritici TaxID=1873425 RepID=UPI001BAC3C3D|nr:hypothetical protein [Paenibacillus tritici]QUL54508.1 hypothetical protein KDC22_30245 [Paenibacillus tritici]